MPSEPVVWCTLPCEGVPQMAFRLAGRSTHVPSHTHHICWSCAAEVTSRGLTYYCKNCQVEGGGPQSVIKTDPDFDPDFAAENSSPA